MEKLKEYKALIIIGLIILGGAFYWFQLRPVQIKKECYQKHLSTPPDLSYAHYLEQKDNPVKENTTPYGEEAYGRCLLEHGL